MKVRGKVSQHASWEGYYWVFFADQPHIKIENTKGYKSLASARCAAERAVRLLGLEVTWED